LTVRRKKNAFQRKRNRKIRGSFDLSFYILHAIMQMNLPEIDFHLTRPFLYVIETYEGAVLFIGTVTNPVFEK